MALAEKPPVLSKKQITPVQPKVQRSPGQEAGWSESEKIVFRFFFLYFFIQAVPLDWKYYRNLFSINWLHLHFGDLFQLSRYTPQFFSHNQVPGTWGLGTFADWGVVAAIALVGAAIWSVRDKNRSAYNELYLAPGDIALPAGHRLICLWFPETLPDAGATPIFE